MTDLFTFDYPNFIEKRSHLFVKILEDKQTGVYFVQHNTGSCGFLDATGNFWCYTVGTFTINYGNSKSIIISNGQYISLSDGATIISTTRKEIMQKASEYFRQCAIDSNKNYITIPGKIFLN